MKPYLIQLPDWLPGPLSGRPIFSYGVMLGISFMLGWSLCAFIAERERFERKLVSSTLFWVIVASLVGARLFHFAFDDRGAGSGNLLIEFFKFSEGGLVAYGGYIGGIVMAWLYLWYKGESFLAFADTAAPAMALGLGFTRIGCFLYGCDYGIASDAPIAAHFPRWEDPGAALYLHGHSPSFEDQLRRGLVGLDQAAATGVHATQLYESLTGFVLFGALVLLRRHKRFDGQILLAFLVLYGIARFCLEIIRGDADRGVGWLGTGLSTSQIISLALVLLAALLWRPMGLKPRRVERTVDHRS